MRKTVNYLVFNNIHLIIINLNHKKMKKNIVLFLITALTLSSCSKSDDSESVSITSGDLVGTWFLQEALLDGKKVSSSEEVEFTAAKRANFKYYKYAQNGQDLIESGGYSVSGSTITVTWDNADHGLEVLKYQIVELSSSKLQLKSVIPNEGTLVETYTK